MKIYESENWMVQLSENNLLKISHFSEGHYQNEIIIDISNKDNVKIVRSDDEV